MIFRSPHPEIHIPEISLTEFVLRRARQLGDKPALIEGTSGRVITYAQLEDSVRRVASGLARLGFQKGDVFAIFSPNLPEYVVAFHAVSMLGGINTTINPLYTADEVAHQLNDARAKYLLTVPQLMDRASEAVNKSDVGEVFVIGDASGATSFTSLLQSDGDPPSVSINSREDTVALPYSSGTTGLPKGVMLTHHNLVANLLQVEATGHTYESDTLVCVLPLFHIYGMAVVMNIGLYNGATIVTMPRFELEAFLHILQDYGVTFAHVVPPIILALAKHSDVDKYDLSKLKSIFSGAAPLGEELTRACAERLGCVMRQGYGMTETSPGTHITPGDPAKIKYGSVGLIVPNSECKIIDTESGAELGIGEEGEICVRGPQVMRGYLNQPDATAQTIDADGWLHTGDVGYADADEHFFIVDRVKELIKYKGFQVAPAELEALLISHPAIADAAVIPSPDEEAGEVPKAFVVLREDVTLEQIMDYIAARVAPHKKIRKIEVIDQIPKSPSGKILRRILVRRERAQKS